MTTRRPLTIALTVTILATALGCSSPPEDEPLIIDIVQDTDGNDTVTDMGRDVEDVSTADQAPAEDTAPNPVPVDMNVEPQGTVCQAKDAPVQLINTCTFEWKSCVDGVEYAFECNIQNLAGNVFSLCNCFENGVMDEADKIVDVCGLSDWEAIEAVVNAECGWDLK